MTLVTRPCRWGALRASPEKRPRPQRKSHSEGHPTLPDGPEPCEGRKRPSPRRAPVPPIPWFLSDPYGPKGTATRQARPRSRARGSFGPSASIRNHAIDALVPWELPERGRGLVPRELLERREPWSLGELPRDRERRDLGSPGPGLARRRLLGSRSSGPSRWEGWGDPLTKAMRGRLSPRPGPSCATVFGRGSPHPSGQTPVPRRPSRRPRPAPALSSPATPSGRTAGTRASAPPSRTLRGRPARTDG